LGDAPAHSIVDAPASQDYLGMIPRHLGAMGQVVGIDADAVTADEPGCEGLAAVP
jgi:hypothetical protein